MLLFIGAMEGWNRWGGIISSRFKEVSRSQTDFVWSCWLYRRKSRVVVEKVAKKKKKQYKFGYKCVCVTAPYPAEALRISFLSLFSFSCTPVYLRSGVIRSWNNLNFKQKHLCHSLHCHTEKLHLFTYSNILSCHAVDKICTAFVPDTLSH